MKGARPLSVFEAHLVAGKFKGRMAVRNLSMFLLGCNTGFRISELLSLTLGDVMDEDGQVKTHVTVFKRHMKGNRSSRTVVLNEFGKKGLMPWLLELQCRGIIHKDEPLFINISGTGAISRIQAWKVLDRAYELARLRGKTGTHTMRKTFANNVYQHLLSRVAAGEPVDAFRATSKALDHADIKSTDQYLSFLTEDIDQSIRAVGV